MSDGTILNLGAGGDTIATEDIAGLKYELVKIGFGSAGVFTRVDAANRLPIALSAADVAAIAPLATQPVSGTFWQATQPVSGAFFQATQPVSLATNTPDVTDRVGRLLGHVTVDNASLAVTGTFFQGTQPVSIAGPVTVTGGLTDTQLRATAVPVSLTSTTITGSVAVTGPLTDTQLRATAVPVSLASTTITGNVAVTSAGLTNLDVALSTRLKPADTLAAVTSLTQFNGVAIALNTGVRSVGTLRVTVATDDLVPVSAGVALTKGTQGANGFTTQDLKDSGRAAIAISSYQAAGIITTEALFAAATFSRSADGAAATTGQQFTVTAGKRFRIQLISVAIKNTAAAAGTSKLALRYNAAGGTITNASPIVAILDLGSNNATAGNYIGPAEMPIPDGFEMIPSSTFGFTSLCGAVTMLHTITVLGFEY